MSCSACLDGMQEPEPPRAWKRANPEPLHVEEGRARVSQHRRGQSPSPPARGRGQIPSLCVWRRAEPESPSMEKSRARAPAHGSVVARLVCLDSRGRRWLAACHHAPCPSRIPQASERVSKNLIPRCEHPSEAYRPDPLCLVIHSVPRCEEACAPGLLSERCRQAIARRTTCRVTGLQRGSLRGAKGSKRARARRRRPLAAQAASVSPP